MRRLILPLAVLAAALACQNYEFRHITPTPVTIIKKSYPISAAPGTPYIMIVQDMSGSMCEPISNDAGVADSGPGAGDCAADPAQSKIGLVATNLSKVLNQLPDGVDGGNPFFIGLTAFPGTVLPDAGLAVAGCAPPSGAIFPIGPAPVTIPKIDGWYATAAGTEGGGTPTAAALLEAGKDPSLQLQGGNIRKYILLLTDGLPNCNLLAPCVINSQPWSDGVPRGCASPDGLAASEPNFPMNPLPTPAAGCTCSYGSCPSPTGLGSQNQCCFADPSTSAPGQLTYEVAAAQCLDGPNTVGVAGSLFNQGVTTFVIGMGEDFTDFSLLDQIAQAGQGSPDAGHLQADNEAQLFAAIDSILVSITSQCTYFLDSAPADPELIEVNLDGTALKYNDPNGFAYATATNSGASTYAVTLQGTACSTVQDGKQHSLDITALGKQ